MAKRKTTVAVSSLSDEFLICHGYGHAWYPYDVQILARPRRYVQIMECVRCETLTRVPLDSTAHRDAVHHRGYTYADGYLLNGARGTVADRRAEARLEIIQRRSNVRSIRRRRAS